MRRGYITQFQNFSALSTIDIKKYLLGAYSCTWIKGYKPSLRRVVLSHQPGARAGTRMRQTDGHQRRVPGSATHTEPCSLISGATMPETTHLWNDDPNPSPQSKPVTGLVLHTTSSDSPTGNTLAVPPVKGLKALQAAHALSPKHQLQPNGAFSTPLLNQVFHGQGKSPNPEQTSRSKDGRSWLVPKGTRKLAFGVIDHPKLDGVIVSELVQEGACAMMGLHVGDHVTHINGHIARNHRSAM